MGKVPIIKQYAWGAVLSQILIMGVLVGLLSLFTEFSMEQSLWLSAALYLAYSVGTRSILAKSHIAGIRHVKAGDFANAIRHFEESYEFFSKWKWLDRFRFLLLGSSSAASYREMALVNIAFCYSQLGNGTQCRVYYERVAAEFPGSALAQAGLNMARSFDSAPSI